MDVLDGFQPAHLSNLILYDIIYLVSDEQATEAQVFPLPRLHLVRRQGQAQNLGRSVRLENGLGRERIVPSHLRFQRDAVSDFGRAVPPNCRCPRTRVNEVFNIYQKKV